MYTHHLAPVLAEQHRSDLIASAERHRQARAARRASRGNHNRRFRIGRRPI